MFIPKLWVLSLSVALISAFLTTYYTWFNHSISIISRIQDIFSSSSHSTSPSSPIIQPQTGLTTSISTSINCTSPPPRTCTFYTACLEPHFHCGPEGYPVGFGEKFCTKFNLPENVGRLSPEGKEWMWTTMRCLQIALVPELQIPVVPTTTGSISACKALEDKAFSTHAPCYLSSGLCSLPPEDWLAIVEIIDIKTLLSGWDAFDGGVEAGKGCLEFFTRALEKELSL